MGALIGGMSLLYAQLMHLSLQAYVPWMSCGIVLWGFISGTITEGCESFASAASIIRQTSLPLFTFVFRT
ncbi:ABC transporter permease, partial [Pseudomonas sp. FW305-BF8]